MINKVSINKIKNDSNFLAALKINEGSSVNFNFLAAGEYNSNFYFIHPETNKKYIVRIPLKSQMNLTNQAKYEYDALNLLKNSNRTPNAIYLDQSKKIVDFDFLVIEFLQGRPLDYKSDLSIAANILADIHNYNIPKNNSLIAPDNPLNSMLIECNNMSKVYFNYNDANALTKKLIKELITKCKTLIEKPLQTKTRCLINTELNSGNFLINGKGKENYLIDWEKPLYAYAQQDLGHFLAPTTTYWKTDCILNETEILNFMHQYSRLSDLYISFEDLWQSTLPFFMMNCLRGVTWCSMAFVEYQNPNRHIRQDDTYKKIKEYISFEFLENIQQLLNSYA